MKRRIGKVIWMSAELFGISLGRFAPVVFGWMIGNVGQKIEEGE